MVVEVRGVLGRGADGGGCCRDSDVPQSLFFFLPIPTFNIVSFNVCKNCICCFQCQFTVLAISLSSPYLDPIKDGFAVLSRYMATVPCCVV